MGGRHKNFQDWMHIELWNYIVKNFKICIFIDPRFILSHQVSREGLWETQTKVCNNICQIVFVLVQCPYLRLHNCVVVSDQKWVIDFTPKGSIVLTVPLQLQLPTYNLHPLMSETSSDGNNCWWQHPRLYCKPVLVKIIN